MAGASNTSKSFPQEPEAVPAHVEPLDLLVPMANFHDPEMAMAVMIAYTPYADPGPVVGARAAGTCACTIEASAVSAFPGPVSPPELLNIPVGTKQHCPRAH